MKKRFWIFMAVVILLLSAEGAVASVNTEFLGELRIGLTSRYANLAAITFDNSEVVAGFERNGVFQPELIIESAAGFVASADSSYYVAVGSFNGFQAAGLHAAALRAQGHRAAPAITAIDQWTVFVGGFSSAGAAQPVSASLGGTIVSPNNRRVVLMENNENLVVFDVPGLPPQFTVWDGNISLGERSYRGRIELMRVGAQNLTAVNIVSMDHYLFSVVPSEMPSTWHIEALKAQAVASRSYAAARRGGQGHTGFDLCDTTHCQVYLGVGAERPRTTSAVNLTSGIMLWHQNRPIEATFFSSSGGHTDNSENVWTGTAPYLRAVADIHEGNPRVWSRVITLGDLDRALAAAGGASVGSATGMHIASSSNNRVQELVITGTAGSRTLRREEIRTFFQPITGGTLESRNFTLQGGQVGQAAGVLGSNVVASDGNIMTAPTDLGQFFVVDQGGSVRAVTGAEGTLSVVSASGTGFFSLTQQQTVPTGSFLISGVGFGHGVGMSQHGAQGMAENGFTFDQILRFYYTGIEVRR